jgi:hypothetical protein
LKPREIGIMSIVELSLVDNNCEQIIIIHRLRACVSTRTKPKIVNKLCPSQKIDLPVILPFRILIVHTHYPRRVRCHIQRHWEPYRRVDFACLSCGFVGRLVFEALIGLSRVSAMCGESGAEETCLELETEDGWEFTDT